MLLRGYAILCVSMVILVACGSQNNGAISPADEDIPVSADTSGTPVLKPFAIPGRIEAEDYHAALDTTSLNEGNSYRDGSVDIQPTTDIGGGFNVGWTAPTEYLRYTVNVNKASTYNLILRAATPQDGASVTIKLDQNIVVESLSIPSTGGWQQWQNVSSTVTLPVGLHELEIYFTTGGVNINYIDVVDQIPPDETPTMPSDDAIDLKAWKLVWQDEFDGSALNDSRWSIEENANGGGNNELQYYTARKENVFVADGRLHIVARKEVFTGQEGTRQYTSGRLRTKNKGDWKYGRFDIKAKLPSGQGMWPAIWMLPTDNRYGTWAASGEIDIMEAVNLDGAGGNQVHGTLHYGAQWPNNVFTGKSYTPPASVSAAFHIYSVEWKEREISWAVDGVVYQTQTKWNTKDAAFPAPFDQRFHLLLNVAIGGNWPGSPDASTVFPQQMEVEYVRVYEGASPASTGTDSGPIANTEPPSVPGSNANGSTIEYQGVRIDVLHATNVDKHADLKTVLPDGRVVTRIGERVRDRHARESQFRAYDHFLARYFENRTFGLEIVDATSIGGNSITFNLKTDYPYVDNNFRAFFRGINTVAEYLTNSTFTPLSDTTYTQTIQFNPRENRPIQKGDLIEFELGLFLRQPVEGRFNYYSRVYLYRAGQTGVIPWQGVGPKLDAEPIPELALLGGDTTLSNNYSDEPSQQFMQMAQNLAPENAQVFVEGRRLVHTSFIDGSHAEAGNPVFSEQSGKAGPYFLQPSCIACHERNGRSVPMLHEQLSKLVFKTGHIDADGIVRPSMLYGALIQPQAVAGVLPETTISLDHEQVTEGQFGDGSRYQLHVPAYSFSSVAPTNYSVRIANPLVGLGLLEAVAESSILSLADADDANKDGISGRPNIIMEAKSGKRRLGRFGWRAGQPSLYLQTAAALRNDMGVTTSEFPTHECTPTQDNCISTNGKAPELDDKTLETMSRYIALLGVPPQRNSDDPMVRRGAILFKQAGCEGCHTATLKTGAGHPLAELRNQTIHPYTDLLLHDMGDGLADSLPEGTAGMHEWRTTPLWGLGLTAAITGSERYLHDGRAHTILEAIVWHDGEAQQSKKDVLAMSKSDREALVNFLRSL